MSNVLKVLVAVTCVAVLAAVGYWFWLQWRAADERAAAQRAEAQKVAVQRNCDDIFDDLTNGRGGHSILAPTYCVIHGYYSAQDLRDAGRDDIAQDVEEFIAKNHPE